MTIDKTLSIDEITLAINELRGKVDSLTSSHNNSSKTIHDINAHEKKLREEFERTLEEIRERKLKAVQFTNSIMDKITDTKYDITEYQKLMAEKLESEAYLRFLEEFERTVAEFVEQLECWRLAADFQRQDVLEIVKAYKTGLSGFANFNDMGLGKTLETILALAIMKQDFIKEHGREPLILWLTKKSLILSTFREFRKWAPELLVIPMKDTNTPADRTRMFKIAMDVGGILLANYEVVNTMPEVKKVHWDFLIVDECHKLKGGAKTGKIGTPSGPSQIWVNSRDVARNSRFIQMLSGTPMVNHPKEMWAYLHIFDPERFDNMRNFEKLFGVYDYGAAEIKLDADKLLKGALQGQCIRRRKDEVGIQLPALNETFRYLEMTDAQRKVYDQMRDSFFIWLNAHDDKKPLSATAIIAKLTRLRQINVWPNAIKGTDDDGHIIDVDCPESSKIDECMDIIKELADEGEQSVVFCTFNEPLKEVQRRCAEMNLTCKVIYGAATESELDLKFQNKEIDVLCINLAMSEGLNLQKSNDWVGGSTNAIFLDLWWTPARNEQAMARIHRIGAIENCTIHILHNEDSIDQFIASKLEDKTEAFASILERNEIRPASEWKKLLKDLV